MPEQRQKIAWRWGHLEFWLVFGALLFLALLPQILRGIDNWLQHLRR